MPDIGGSVQEKPGFAVGADGGGGLGQGLYARASLTDFTAEGAVTIPLGEPAAGGRSQ